MHNTLPTEVRYNPRTRVFLMFFSAASIFLGIFLIVQSFRNVRFANPNIPLIGGLFVLLGVLILFLFRKVLINKKVMLIDDSGLTTYSGKGFIGFLPWNDVTDVKKRKVDGVKYVTVHISDNKKYIESEQAAPNKAKMEYFLANTETPIAFSTRGLSLDYYALLGIIERKLNLFKKGGNI